MFPPEGNCIALFMQMSINASKEAGVQLSRYSPTSAQIKFTFKCPKEMVDELSSGGPWPSNMCEA